MADSMEEEKNLHEATTMVELQNSSSSEVHCNGSSCEEDSSKVKGIVVQVEGGKAKRMLEEMELRRNEWKLAIEAEGKSTKAMEDLAFTLKEVVTECNYTKENLRLTKDELEGMKEIVRSTEERYQKLIQEAREEAMLNKNMADRLRLEADEALLAWNEKEVGFVRCIKRAEEEKATAQNECYRLGESLKEAEDLAMAAREEMCKSRDILQQAINEANAAKTIAGIARDENTFLKDCIAEKEKKLQFLAIENERFRVSEAVAEERINRLKFLLSIISAGYKDDESETMNRGVKKTFSFTLDDLKLLNDLEDETNSHEDTENEEHKGKNRIVDQNVEIAKSEPQTPLSIFTYHRRRHSYAVSDDGNTAKSQDFEHSYRRMRKVFEHVGNLLTIRRGFHFQKRKEASIES